MSNLLQKFCSQKLFPSRRNNGFSLKLVFCSFWVNTSHYIFNNVRSFTSINTHFYTIVLKSWSIHPQNLKYVLKLLFALEKIKVRK